MKSPIEPDYPRMSIKRFKCVAFDQDVFRLLLALDVILVENLQCVGSIWRVFVGDEADL